MNAPCPLSGFRLVPAYLDPSAQKALLAELSAVFAAAPLYTPRMPKSGKPLSVRMTNCGPLGWVTDEGGYRYQPTHPETGQDWPPMPELLLRAWQTLSDYAHRRRRAWSTSTLEVPRWACIRTATNSI